MLVSRLLGSVLLFCAFGVAQAEQSSLLEMAQDLHCTQSEQQATKLIARLAKESIMPFGLPDENLSDQSNTELYAATIDILLQVLYDTIQRYPKLQESVEKTVLHWNFCEMVNEGDLADLTATQKAAVIQKKAIGPFPAKQRGFSIWGFINRDAGKRYVPEIYKSLSPFPNAYQDFIYRLTQKQCFPHPELEQDISHQPYSGAYRMPRTKLVVGKKYPYTWDEQCPEKSPSKIEQSKIPKEQPVVNGISTPANKLVAKFVAKPAVQSNVKHPVKAEIAVIKNVTPPAHDRQNHFVPEASIALPDINSSQKLTPIPTPPLKQKLALKAKSAEPKVIDIQDKYKDTLALVFKEYKQPTEKDVSVILPTIPSDSANVGLNLPVPQPPADGLGLAGNLYHTAKLTGEMTFGANVSWKPFSYIKINCGVSYGYLPASGSFKYACSAGYDDWHPGSFAMQLPLFDNNGLAFKKIAPSLGYKFDADFLKEYNLSGSASVSVPLSGSPSVATSWQWSPAEHWFIRAGLQRSFGSQGSWSWSYGFGYSDFRPFKLSLTYDNVGPNPIFDGKPDDGVNFKENGVVSLSWGWAF
ncbi:MAG: DUF3131 domain-containing protein [Methylococcaceae bacterium]|nr:DUF3131 domain-containing protein [Methylococcaceae bacterium]